ncbi:serine/threonine-protein phosphatase with EF-hands 1 isoform X2 [Hemitrygon akajei]|uniref:serine/threonine-protein phosphatase with EF-hands 1 isoform X2 n=1 Tax=Hemitrygon akajei TaxID=2704970 RepID=UPI003BF9B1B0
MEMKRRYTWTIFQSIEYAGEQDQSRQLHSLYVLQLLQETKKIVKKMPNIIHLSTHYSKDITVCGDLHGKLDDLLLIFYKNGLPMPEKPYVFNGDFVDRGENSMEVIIILFAFLLIFPNDVHLNRGNHEDYVMNIRYGFQKEVLRKYKTQGKRILQLVQDVFRWLPLATVIDSKVLVIHGGISDTTDLDFLASIERQRFKSLLRVQRSLGKCEETCQKKHCLEQYPSKKLDHDGRVCETLLNDQGNKRLDSSPSSSSPLMSTCTKHYEDQCHLSKCTMSPSNSNYQQDQMLDCNKHKMTEYNVYNATKILQMSYMNCAMEIPEVPPREELEWKQIADVLWSDPRNQAGCVPNTIRGGGCYFGEDITDRMLKKYNLKLIIRSHECKQDGYEVCHNGKVITIFSASNYYEEGSNQGAYIKLGPDLIPHFVKYRVNKSTRKLTLKERVSVIEESALKSLREKLFAHKSEVIAAFRKYDPDYTGKISLNQWALAVDSVLHLNLPWRTIRPRLVQSNADGIVDYLSTFECFQTEHPMKEVQPNLIEAMYKHRADLEIIFGIIDKDHSGLISMEEFRQTWKLFSSHLHIHLDDQSVDDLARSIDINKDGSIDFNEFLEAFRLVQKDNK